jgi:hypothetical protein
MNYRGSKSCHHRPELESIAWRAWLAKYKDPLNYRELILMYRVAINFVRRSALKPCH